VNQKQATPRDAAAVILLNQSLTEVLWAQRNPNLAFLGGYHAFPGGKLETTDAETKVFNCKDAELAKFIACAVREAFEEVGVLLARNGEKLTRGQRASLHDDLISGRFTFAEILAHWNLWIDAEDFIYTGFWTTPAFSPVRFKTRFFLAVCPPKQEPYAAISELQNVEFIKPRDALRRWEKSEVLIAPPVLLSLKELAADVRESREQENTNLTIQNKGTKSEIVRFPPSSFHFSEYLSLCAEKLLKKSQQSDGQIKYIELNPRIVCFPLKTDTLPPSTHTNCFVVGREEFIIVDAAAREKAEQDALHKLIDSFVEKGFVCQRIIISHLHQDHFGGETILQRHLSDKFGLRVPLAAHRLTAESLPGEIKIDRFIEGDEVIQLKDKTGKIFELKVLHTPGHARGHLCFYDEESGFLLASDNVVGSSSVIIAPPEGNMRDYLDSLEKMKNLPNLKFLCGSHGAAHFDARTKIDEYIEHRLRRELEILSAVQEGALKTDEIVEKVYTDVSPELYQLAEKSVEAHLEKLKMDGKI
jgi:glyoxylase-like metal-dependent hydrolase (beta-lactamase superfamily II)/8-oxo-dGTP pyrophosphatase MutT (NUDIX family)